MVFAFLDSVHVSLGSISLPVSLISPSFPGSLPDLTGFYRVLLVFTGFYWILLDFTGFLPSFTGFLIGLTWFDEA